MLKTLFDATGKLLIFIMLLLLLASFVVWGVGDVVRDTYNDTAAEVNGKAIPARYIDELVQNRRNQIIMATGKTELPEGYDDLLKASILRQVINQELVTAEADKLGFKADGRTVLKEAILKDKTVNRDNFRDFLRAQGKTEAQYIKELSNIQAIGFLEQAITGNPPITDFQVTKADALANEQRVYEYVELSVNVNKQVQPSDSELQEFYEANKQNYVMPEKRDVTVLVIDRSALNTAPKKEQSNIEKVDSFHANPGDLGDDDQSHESISQEVYGLSNIVLDRIAEGKTLEEISKEMNLKLLNFKSVEASGQNADNLPKVRNLLKNVFSSEKGATSELLEDDKAETFAVFRVDSVEPSRERTLEEAKTDAIAHWRAEAAYSKLEDDAKALQEKARTEGLAKAAAEKGLSLKTAKVMHQDSRLPKAFLDELFSFTDNNSVTNVYPTGNSFIIARLAEVIPSSSDELEKFAVKSTLQDEVKQELMQQYLMHISGKHKVKIK
jgi:peptidyl-prolyl cis-trans isomerase D